MPKKKEEKVYDFDVDIEAITIDDLETISLVEYGIEVPEYRLVQFVKNVVTNMDIGKYKAVELEAIVTQIGEALKEAAEPEDEAGKN